MTQPRVSVVIPTYNQAAFLKEALRSVIDQTMADWEAIVINNFSDDDTTDVVDSFHDPRIRRINFRNEGVIGASRNRGIALARADWIAFLDSDDLWVPEKLERCLAVVDEGTNAVSHIETMVRGGKVLGLTPRATQASIRFQALLYNGNCLSPTAIMLRKPLLDSVGGFSEDPAHATAEDYDLWIRLAQVGMCCRIIPEPLSQFTLHGASASASIERHLATTLAVLDRHFAALGTPSLFEALRRHRARARAFYGAGRAFQKAGRRGEAMRFLTRSLGHYPLAPRCLAALALCIIDSGKSASSLSHQEPALPKAIPLWIWVTIMMTAYLYQFRHLSGPILAALGVQ